MSDPWGMDCASNEQPQAKCDVCIGTLIALGNELLPALTSPAGAAIDLFADWALKLTKRLKWAAKQQLAAIEATLTALGPMPSPLVVGLPPSLVGPDGALPTAASEPSAAESSPVAITSVSEPHDVDQANLLILADPTQPWHLALRAWYAGALDSALLAPTILDAIAAREQASNEKSSQFSGLSGMTSHTISEW